MSSEPKSINRKPWESRRPFTAYKSCVSGVERKERFGFVFCFSGSVTLFKMDQQNLLLLITAAIVWAVYQAKIRNGTFENASRQRPASGVLPLVTLSFSLVQQRTALAGLGSDGVQSTDTTVLVAALRPPLQRGLRSAVLVPACPSENALRWEIQTAPCSSAVGTKTVTWQRVGSCDTQLKRKHQHVLGHQRRRRRCCVSAVFTFLTASETAILLWDFPAGCWIKIKQRVELKKDYEFK